MRSSLDLASLDLASPERVGRSECFVPAFRALDVTPSAVTQRLQDLKRRVGVRLVDRSGWRLVLSGGDRPSSPRGRPAWLRSRGSPFTGARAEVPLNVAAVEVEVAPADTLGEPDDVRTFRTVVRNAFLPDCLAASVDQGRAVVSDGSGGQCNGCDSNAARCGDLRLLLPHASFVGVLRRSLRRCFGAL